MKTPGQLWRLCFVAILAIAMMPAQLQAQSEIPKLKAPTRKLRTAFSKVVAQYQMKYNYTYALEETKARYATVMAKVPEEMAAANWFMAEMTENLKQWDENFIWLLKAEASLKPTDHFFGTLTHSRLAWSYYLGRGCERDEERALEHFIKSYEYDNVRGAYGLGEVYLHGLCIGSSNYLLALDYFEQSVHNQQRWPIIYAIEYYLNGKEHNTVTDEAWETFLTGYKLYMIDSKPKEAIPYFESACDMGFIPAYEYLADLHLEYEGIPTAIQTILPASNAGYAPALHQHGYYLMRRTYGKVGQWADMNKAADLIGQAASMGYPVSQMTLGEMYAKGYGTTIMIDWDESLKWYEAAVRNGEPAAKEGRNLALKEVKKRQYEAIASEIENLSYSISEIIDHYSEDQSSGITYSRSNNSDVGGESSYVNEAEVRRHRKFFDGYAASAKSWLNTYAEAVAEKETAKDQLALNHAQDKLRRAEERLESLLRSMEHHRQQAEHNGGSIPTHDIELTIRELMD